jgi:hypothetical protein
MFSLNYDILKKWEPHTNFLVLLLIFFIQNFLVLGLLHLHLQIYIKVKIQNKIQEAKRPSITPNWLLAWL